MPLHEVLYFTGIFSSSLLGSLHCLGMCGALAATQNQFHLRSLYHSSRLFGYLSLGGLAGLLGDALLFSWLREWIAPTAGIFTALVLVYLAWRLYQEPTRRFHLKIPGIQKIFSALSGKPKFVQALGIGFFTAFLPCGWLYSFVLIAATSGGWLQGSFTLFIFWLGTLPILLLGSKLTELLPRKQFAMLILLVAMGTLGLKFYPNLHGDTSTEESCHATTRP